MAIAGAILLRDVSIWNLASDRERRRWIADWFARGNVVAYKGRGVHIDADMQAPAGISRPAGRGGRLLLPFSWQAVVLIRAAGTAVGDFISGRNMLGLPVSTAVTGLFSLPSWSSGGSSRDRRREIAIVS